MELTSPDLTLTLQFDVVESNHQVYLFACCPVKRQQTMSNQVKPIFLESGKGLWWHCAYCQGWHIIVLPEEATLWPDLWHREAVVQEALSRF